MVNAIKSNNCVDMGAFTVQKHSQNGSVARSVYKLLINIEKIKPKPCPRSKKLAFLSEARKIEYLKAGITLASSPKPVSSTKRQATCKICKEIFQSVQSLYLHKKKKHFYVCGICDAECATKILRQSHEILHKSDDPVLPYKCHLCLKTFDTKANTRLHVRVIHTLVELEFGDTDKPEIKVLARPEIANKKQTAIVEKTEVDSKKIAEKTKKIDNKTMTSNYAGLTFTCRVCSKDFATVEDAEAHTADHMEIADEEHKCSICKKLFKDEMSLNDHLAEHMSRALRCPVCPKAFINRATLRIHMKSHGQG